jgi:hypothetical protein
MSAQLKREHAADAKLAVHSQPLSGMADGWGMGNLDCFAMLK